MKVYITFGFEHAHTLANGVRLDKDCVAVLTCKDYQEGREFADRRFGRSFSMCYADSKWDENKMVYFPNGYVALSTEV